MKPTTFADLITLIQALMIVVDHRDGDLHHPLESQMAAFIRKQAGSIPPSEDENLGPVLWFDEMFGW